MKHPFNDSNEHTLRKSILDDEPAEIPPDVSPFLKELIGQLLDKNPEKRPTSDMLITKKEIKIQIRQIIDEIQTNDHKIGELIYF